MTADIVQLNARADQVWTCADCGCQSFKLYGDGRTECELCGRIGTDCEGAWLEHLNETTRDMPAARTVVPHSVEEFAKQATLRSIDENTKIIIAMWPNGRIKAWNGFDEAEYDRVVELMATATTLLLNIPDGSVTFTKKPRASR